jgi:hypothetical protein
MNVHDDYRSDRSSMLTQGAQGPQILVRRQRMKADGATCVHRVPLACTIHTLQLAKNSTIRSTVDGVRYKLS